MDTLGENLEFAQPFSAAVDNTLDLGDEGLGIYCLYYYNNYSSYYKKTYYNSYNLCGG